MDKTMKIVVCIVCVTCTLFQKCNTEITVSSFVNTSFPPSANAQLTMTTHIPSPTYNLNTIVMFTSSMYDTNERNIAMIPDTQEIHSDNNNIVSSVAFPVYEEQSKIFFPGKITPSRPILTYEKNEISENNHYFQTPELNSSLLYPVQDSYFHTYFATEEWPTEYSENYVSFNMIQESGSFAKQNSSSYNTKELEKSVGFSNPNLNVTVKAEENDMENVSNSNVGNFHLTRMGKEVLISVLHETNSAIVPDGASLMKSEMLYTINLPNMQDNIFEGDSKATMENEIAPTSKVYDSTFSHINNQILISASTEEKTNENNSDIPNAKHVMLILKKDCVGISEFQNMFAVLNTHLMGLLSSVNGQSTNINTINCDAVFHLKLAIDSATDHMINELTNVLLSNITFGEDLRVEKVFSNSDEYEKFLVPSEAKNDHYKDGLLIKREIIAYIVAGICLGLFICTLMTCCCMRILCKKQTNSLDLCDIPHLNLKLEDYKLTPIPRPTISFPEYGREMFNSTYNDPTRIEDTILNHHNFSGDVNSRVKDLANDSREMRTFGSKKSCTRVQSLDVRPNTRSENGWISNSTEKLNSDFEKKNGYDNGGFRKWF